MAISNNCKYFTLTLKRSSGNFRNKVLFTWFDNINVGNSGDFAILSFVSLYYFHINNIKVWEINNCIDNIDLAFNLSHVNRCSSIFIVLFEFFPWTSPKGPFGTECGNLFFSPCPLAQSAVIYQGLLEVF
jgi:hypothetical protein